MGPFKACSFPAIRFIREFVPILNTSQTTIKINVTPSATCQTIRGSRSGFSGVIYRHPNWTA